jgi:hypothetical protein
MTAIVVGSMCEGAADRVARHVRSALFPRDEDDRFQLSLRRLFRRVAAVGDDLFDAHRSWQVRVEAGDE